MVHLELFSSPGRLEDIRSLLNMRASISKIAFSILILEVHCFQPIPLSSVQIIKLYLSAGEASKQAASQTSQTDKQSPDVVKFPFAPKKADGSPISEPNPKQFEVCVTCLKLSTVQLSVQLIEYLLYLSSKVAVLGPDNKSLFSTVDDRFAVITTLPWFVIMLNNITLL